MSKSRDIADSAATINYIDNVTSDVQSQINTLDTALDNISVTSGTLTKTFAQNEIASINLTSSVLAPVVSVMKEIPAEIGQTNNNWDVNSTTENYTRIDSAYATALNLPQLGNINITGENAAYQQIFIPAVSGSGTRRLVFKYTNGTTGTNTYDGDIQIDLIDIDGTTYDFENADEGFQVSEAGETTYGGVSWQPLAVGATAKRFNVHTGNTASSNTGDLGAASGSYFVYAETSSPVVFGDVFWLRSPAITFDGSTPISFYVGRQGSNIGTLEVYIDNAGTLTQLTTQAFINPLQLETGSFASADVGKTIEANSGVFVLTATDGSYVETTAPTSYGQVASGDWSMYGVVYNATDGDLELSGTGSVFATGYQPVHTTASTNTTYWSDINSMTADQNAGDGNVYYAISTDDRTTWTVIDNTDGERDIVRNNAGTWQYNSNVTYALETWVNGTTNTELATLAEAMEGAEGTPINPFDVSTAVYSQNFSIASEDDNHFGLTFNTDGTKMFTCGSIGDDVNEYLLSTPFDVSTASFVDSFNFAAQETSPRGVAFSTDGTKMFITGTLSDSVNEYTLSTGFDVSTASYSQAFSVLAQDSTIAEITFNNDGTKMFIVGSTNDNVYEYALSTGFDVSTASFSQSFSVAAQETLPAGMCFNADGTKMFIVGTTGDDVNEYTLSTGFDVSTASFVDSFSVSGQETSPSGIAFNNDGTKMFIVGTAGDAVQEYNVGTPSYINQMDKTQLDAVTDPNHIALGNDLDLAIIFNMTSGTTVPSSDGVAINYDASIINKGAVLGTDYDFDAPTQNSVRITALAANNLKVRVV